MNISVRWRDAADRIIVLDAGDAIEGWTRTSDTLGVLSKGVCESLRDTEGDPSKRAVPEQAIDIHLATACPTKLPLQPFCPGVDGRVGIGAQLP